MAGSRRTERQVMQLAVVCLVTAIAAALTAPPPGAAGDAPLILREVPRAGDSARVQIELKARGLYRPGLPPQAKSEARMPKPLSMQIETRLVFNERIVWVDRAGRLAAAGRAGDPGGEFRSVRHVVQAASTINGDVRPTSALIRPEVCLLVAARRATDGPVVVVSPAGALTWSELELVQGLGDPLVLGEILPEKAVQPGDSWRIREPGVKALSGYDVISASALEATLESVDAARARVRLRGEVRGSALGGPGTISCEGFLTFDRKAARVDHVDLNRTETRQPGPIEAGLELKSTLIVSRQPAVPPATLSDSALARADLGVTPERELLRLPAPGGRAILLHDRHWHLFWQDPRLTVLKRLEQGQVIAQCNLAVGPSAGKGRHQDPSQFRDDVRRALQSRFVRFLGAGEVDGDPAGGFRYKVGVLGHEGELGVVWYYYLLASPEGAQLLATFTLAQDHAQTFGDQDQRMIGSLRYMTDAGNGQ
jgi:hypothetical protein